MSRSSVDSTARTSPPGQHGQPGSGASNQASSLAAEGNVTVSPTAKRHQRIVLADPVALVYLEEDPSTTLLHRRTILEGYEIYVVEQWACSRVHPTFIIATYTGDLSHHIAVGVLSIPVDSSSWSPRLKLYFDAVQQYHAAAKETPLGTLMVTNLSAFPSALTVIAIPDGDVRKNRDLFVVNENLKRLGCAGRASLKLEEPSPVVKAKFYQLYKASERVPLKIAVMELVRQCQLALTLFGKLAPEYADGLLCDVTEKAIVDWWADIGTDQYNVEPSDGILGATTVAALLGALMGARNRLHAVGAPVPKDVFDLSGMKRGISSFQKSQKLERTRRLDRDTLDRLYRVSQRATNSDRWAGAVKSTVAELSGKGGEMVMGMVGRDRGGISDIETLDLEQFTKLVHGERARWLWQGKPRKSTLNNGSESTSRADDAASTADEQGSYVWTGRKRTVDTESGLERVTPEVDNTRRLHDPESVTEERDFNLGRIVSRSLTGKVSDARAGFGRFKDAVGIPSRRSHHHQHHSYSAQRIRQTHSIDLMTAGNAEEMDANADETDQTAIATEQEGLDLIEEKSIGEPRTKDHTGIAQEDQTLESSTPPSVQKVTPEIHVVPESPPALQSDQREELSISKQNDEETLAQESEGLADDDKALELSKTRSMEAPSEQDVSDSTLYRCLRRSRSFSDEKCLGSAFERKGRWPRHLSFSTVEEVVLVWEGFKTVSAKSDEAPASSLEDEILHECVLMADAQAFGSGVLELSQQTIPWVEGQVGSVEILHRKVNALQEKWEYQYPEHLEHIEAIRERITQLLGDGGSRLTEDMKRIEMLGAKLDYELNVLESKIEDVEEGLRDFSRNVGVVEGRIRGLVQGEQKNHTSWFSWAGRKFGRF